MIETGEFRKPKNKRERLQDEQTDRKTQCSCVDDDETLRQMLGEFLMSEGFEVIAAADGKEALEITLYHPRPWHAIITDFQMPHIDGAGLIRSVSEHSVQCDRFIVLTGLPKSDPKVQELFWEYSVEIISKPFEGAAVLKALR